MGSYISDRWPQLLSASWQHFSLVTQCLLLATVLAIIIAALCYRNKTLSELANSVSAVGLTIPSFALIGLMMAPLGFGVAPAVVVVTFYCLLPILRNALVGLAGVDRSLIEAARGIGMSSATTFFKVELPIAWPVILEGMRVSAQMTMGVAAISAYVLGPGLGSFIFSGLSRMGGANSLEAVLTAVIAVALIALILDGLLLLLGRLTISRGIRA